MGIPLNVCHFAFPACVGCLAIRRHWQLLKTGQEAREDTVEYMFHSTWALMKDPMYCKVFGAATNVGIHCPSIDG